MACRWRAAHQLLHPEVQQPGAHPHHIHQGIKGAHLVEVHLLGAVAVHRRLSHRQQAKHFQHPLPQRLGPGGRLQLAPQIAPEPMGRLALQAQHLQMQTAQAAAAALFELQAIGPGQAEGGEGGIDLGLGKPQIQQGCQKHVAR